MIYVMSDIHGNRRRFDSVMEQINLQPEDHLYVIGDVIDRHPHGIDILLQIMEMTNATMLLGNHEYMMLNAIDYFKQGDPLTLNTMCTCGVETARLLPYRRGNNWMRQRKRELSGISCPCLLQKQ